MFSFRRMAILLSYVMNIKIEAIGVSVNDTSLTEMRGFTIRF